MPKIVDNSRKREGAVYLHYNDVSRRELVIDRSNPGLDLMLAHQAFIQYFRSFIPNPPEWMREVFAIYFNSVRFNKNISQLEFEENLSWLDTVKNLGPGMPSLESILVVEPNTTAHAMFQPVAWALVSYFLNNSRSPRFSLADTRRTLTDTFLLLSPVRSAYENSLVVNNRIASWINIADLTADFDAYIHSRKTYSALVDFGSKAYAAHDYPNAENYFLEALQLKPNHPAAYYYLGLLAFEKGDSDAAEYYYTTALNLGANTALVCYALGVNAAKHARNDEAIYYLEYAISFDSQRYAQRAGDMIARLRPVAQ
jgi:tetratricopeptide (TPR) repeat protein